MKRRPAGLLIGSWMVLAGLFTSAASASSIDDKKAEAARIASKQAELVRTAERLNEESKAAEDRLTTLGSDIVLATNRLREQDASLAEMNTRLAAFARNSYVNGQGQQAIDLVLSMDDLNKVSVRSGYAGSMVGSSADALDEVQAARQDMTATATILLDKQREQTRVAEALAIKGSKIISTQADLDRLATQVDTQLATLVAEEAQRQAAAQLAKEKEATAAEAARQASATTEAQPVESPAAPVAPARKPVSSPVTQPGSKPTNALAKPAAPTTQAPKKPANAPATSAVAKPTASAPQPPATTAKPKPPPTTAAPTTNFPAPSSGAAAAVAEAKRQLGKKYVFGAVGPDTFDCSGLTQWAWRKAGVSMSHYTVSQYNEFPHVPTSALQPGDLVFFKVDLGHMGMYIGGGQVIHAPQTGDVVKISPLSAFNVVGASRPG